MKKKFGFSLAEALITLLIVCLITLATVPVLTKKKRDTVDTGSGKWICTMNSQGQHVYWNSQTSEQDITKPDTWMVSGDGTSCVFVPPMKAKNFAITLIGGGGGGADGVSERKEYIKADDTSKIIEIPEDGVYNVAVFGAGGGGHGSDDHDGSNGTNFGIGGQGGAGGYYIGKMSFRKGDQVRTEVAPSGSGAYDGDKNCKNAYDKDSGWTTLYANGAALISAGTGASGRSTGNRGGEPPRCGDGGSGGTIVTSSYLSTYTAGLVVSSNGQTGRKNRIQKYCRDAYGEPISRSQDVSNIYRGYAPEVHGRTIPTDLWGGINPNYYGWGGKGALYQARGGSTGLSGDRGHVLVWRVIQKAGLGGGASALTTIPLPTIKGKVKVVVGEGGNANEDGKMTYAYIYNLQGKIDKTLYSTIGTVRTGGFSNNKNSEIIDGESGQMSMWNSQGGGLPGKCQKDQTKNVEKTGKMIVYDTDSSGKEICEVAYLNIGPVRKYPVGGGTSAYLCPLSSSTLPKGLCTGCFDVNCKFAKPNVPYFNNAGATSYMRMIERLRQVDPYDNNDIFTFSDLERTAGTMYVKVWDSTSPSLMGYRPDEVQSNGGVTAPSIDDGDIQCLYYRRHTEEYKYYKYEYTPAHCDPGGNGTYFGAGGGGGGSSNTIGLSGPGGRGAPGAVIIEW